VDVACGEDEHGIWVHGAVRPDATPEQIRTLMASPPSGDWRNIGGNLELIGVLAVNIPGFPIRRAMAASANAEAPQRVRVAVNEGVLQTLIASLPPRPQSPAAPPARRRGTPASAAVRERYARQFGRDAASVKARRVAAALERIGRS
jgi:predicted component of type VI protein secretion system